MNPTDNNQHIEKRIVIVISLAILVGVLGYTWDINTGSKYSRDFSLAKIFKKFEPPVALTLIEKESGKPLANTFVRINSGSGILCVSGPCEISNDKSWEGTTNADGELSVPGEYIQTVTGVSPEGYSSTSLPWDGQERSYQVLIDP